MTVQAIDDDLRGDARAAGRGPRFPRLRDRMIAAMAGILRPGASLPPERALASPAGLSRITVRRAIHALAEAGLMERKQGSGSVVKGRPWLQPSLQRLTSFTEDMAQRGLSTRSIWPERGLLVPTREETPLDLVIDAQVGRIARLRLSDDAPMAIERAARPVDLLPNPTIVTRSLYDVRDADGNRPVRAVQKVSAANLGRAGADRLGVPDHAAGLRIERVSYLASGRVVEFTKTPNGGDAFDLGAELQLCRGPDRTCLGRPC